MKSNANIQQIEATEKKHNKPAIRILGYPAYKQESIDSHYTKYGRPNKVNQGRS
jgi:hypothetical protein